VTDLRPAVRASPDGESSPLPAVIELDDVTVAGDGAVPRLRDVRWRVGAGEHWAVLGPNGAGKSTLLQVLAGTVAATTGRVRVLGQAVGSPRMRDPRRHMGTVSAIPPPLARGMTPLDVVLNGVGGSVAEQGRRPTGEEHGRALALLEQLGCAELRGRRFGDCSHGERQRVLIARALVRRPPLLALDEPAAGLDILGRETLLAALARVAGEQPELTTVTVTHHMEELPASTTHALLLRAGAVVDCGPAARVLDGGPVSACFGLPLAVRRSAGRWFAHRA
jgi:iron complex transport system ATP-binding protein